MRLDLTDKSISILPGDMLFVNEIWFGDDVPVEGRREPRPDSLEGIIRFRSGTMLLVMGAETYLEEGGYRRWHVDAFCGFRFVKTVIFEPGSRDGDLCDIEAYRFA